jgi:hypothetical protein
VVGIEVANQSLPTVMAPDGLVDFSPTLGKLGKTSWCLSLLFGPLPEQFSDVHRRAPIRVRCEPAHVSPLKLHAVGKHHSPLLRGFF